MTWLDTWGDDFYKAIGEAITQWQFVEYALLRVFESFFDPADQEEIPYIFYSVSSSIAKIDMVDNAGSNHLGQNKESLEIFSELISQYRRLSTLRNDMAHNMAIDESGPYMLSSNPYNITKKSKRPPQSAEDIISTIHEFDLLANNLLDSARYFRENRDNL